MFVNYFRQKMKFYKLFRTWTGLYSLRKLYVYIFSFFSGNNLWSLPQAVFCSLSSLNSLDLSGNFIQDVSDLGFASSQLNSCRIPLRNLDLSHNSLSTLASKGIFLYWQKHPIWNVNFSYCYYDGKYRIFNFSNGKFSIITI